MPDFTMCRNEICPLNSDCRRFTAEPNEHYQSYAEFCPDRFGKCEFYLANLPKQENKKCQQIQNT